MKISKEDILAKSSNLKTWETPTLIDLGLDHDNVEPGAGPSAEGINSAMS